MVKIPMQIYSRNESLYGTIIYLFLPWPCNHTYVCIQNGFFKVYMGHAANAAGIITVQNISESVE